MKAWYTDHFVLPVPPGHRFPMSKYALLRRRVERAGAVELAEPAAASDECLLLAHSPEYLKRVVDGTLSDAELRRIGFPWSAGMVERSRRSSGATIAACRQALIDGVAVNLAGGTHHAFRDCGEGFCVFNDAAVAARVLQAEGKVRRVVVLDCDVHQGNGTASILRDDPSIFTFSIHGARNFPLRKETSDLDIALPDATEDAVYLLALDRGLRESLERADADLAIFLAGADPYFDDRFGRMCLTKEGLARRDQLVFTACREAGVPVAVTMAGGYARNIEDIVDIHYQTITLAARLF